MELTDDRQITKIKANPLLSPKKFEFQRMRVAAYCRVSTDSEDQIESYKAQVAYYTDTIAKNPNWTLVHIYADEGITGTATKNRESFNRLMRDCEKGRIDYILTKSVSRFARNTVDALRYVRKLKKRGIGVYFEEQCLDTLKAENEMALGLYSVMAQSESENISANVRWGIQQRMKSGTFKFRYNILGYKKGADGNPEIVESEAVHIREIYDMYLSGKSVNQIKDYLDEHKIATKKGCTEWKRSTIKSILTNERYCGDMLMQKTYVENCITKKSKVNRGEFPKYLITNNHPAIVDKSTFNAVQREMAKRTSKCKVSDKAISQNSRYSAKYALSELLFCEECGKPYRRRTWVKKDGTKEYVWMCLRRMEYGKNGCKAPNLHETKLHSAICKALLKVYNNFGGAMDCITASIAHSITGSDTVLDVFAIEKQIKELNKELQEVVSIMQKTSGDRTKYFSEIKKLSNDIVVLKKQLEVKDNKIQGDERVSKEIKNIKGMFETKENIINYRDSVVRMVVENIIVRADSSIVITLKGGYKIEEQV